MGNEDIGGRRRDDRLPLRLAAGILGKADKGRHDFNSHDGPSYDAPAALPESPADFRLKGVYPFENIWIQLRLQ